MKSYWFGLLRVKLSGKRRKNITNACVLHCRMSRATVALSRFLLYMLRKKIYGQNSTQNADVSFRNVYGFCRNRWIFCICNRNNAECCIACKRYERYDLRPMCTFAHAQITISSDKSSILEVAELCCIHGERRERTYSGGLGRSSQWGPEAKPLIRRLGASPLKLVTFNIWR